MKNVYEIHFRSKHTINGKKAQWSNSEPIHVLANGSIQKAVKKAERHLLSRVERFWDEGVYLTERCVAVQVTSVELVAKIDVE